MKTIRAFSIVFLTVCSWSVYSQAQQYHRVRMYCWYDKSPVVAGDYVGKNSYVSAIFVGSDYGGVMDRVYARAFDRYLATNYGETFDTSNRYYDRKGNSHSRCNYYGYPSIESDRQAMIGRNFIDTGWRFSGDETDPGIRPSSGQTVR